MLRPQRALPALFIGFVLLSGCGHPTAPTSPGSTAGTTPETTSKGPSRGPSGSPAPLEKFDGTTIEITVKGEKLSPQGASIKVAVRKPVKLRIVADQPGELHLHSSPEQQFSYSAGTTVKTFTLDRPGVVELESHTLDRLVAQLEVR